jgi:hypothetical protein
MRSRGRFASQIFALRDIGMLKFRQQLSRQSVNQGDATHCIIRRFVGIASRNVFACNRPMFWPLVVPLVIAKALSI